MRQGCDVVFDVFLLETEVCKSLGCQGNVVVALACMTHEETLSFLEILQRPDDVGIRVGAGAFKEFLCQDACLLLFLKEA